MEIKQETRGEVHVLAPVGRIDAESSMDFELAIQDLLDAGARHFVIDFGEVGYVSSAGLRVLTSLANQVAGGGSLKLAAMPEQVRKAVDLAGMTRQFAILDSLDAALGAAAKARPAAKPAAAAKAEPAAKPARAAKAEAAESRSARAEPAKAEPAKADARKAEPAKPPASRPADAAAGESIGRVAARLMGTRGNEAARQDPAVDRVARAAAELLGKARDKAKDKDKGGGRKR